MLVDIHTHKVEPITGIQIINLSVFQAVKYIGKSNSDFYSVGIHPWDAEKFDSEWLSLLQKIAADKMVLAIGECGLDKSVSTEATIQYDMFEKQIIISENFKKPLIIHCVGYFNELMVIRKKCNPQQKWIIHGFRGKPQLALQLLNCGISLSYGEKFNEESIRITPTSELFIETDESKTDIKIIYEKIAKVKQCDISELSAGYKLIKNLI